MSSKADVYHALPFKLILFVLVDGWSLVAGSLVQSYGG
jgi:flagellar biosynthesis protein FliP